MHCKGNVFGWEAMQTQHSFLFRGEIITGQKGTKQTQSVMDIKGVMPTIGPRSGPCQGTEGLLHQLLQVTVFPMI